MDTNNTNRRKVRKGKGKKIALVIVIVFIILLASLVAFVKFYPVRTIADNVYVNSLSVGGLTVDEASKLLTEKINNDYLGKTVEVKYSDKVFEAELLGVISIDADETAKEAMKHSKSILDRIINKNKIVIPFELEEHDKELSDRLTDFAREAEKETGVFTFNDDYTSVSVDANNVDKLLDVDETLELIYENAEKDKFDSVDAVLIAKNDDDFAEELYSRLSRPAKNASVEMNDAGNTYIVAEEYGVTADEDEFERLYKAKNGVFTMNINPIEPEIKTKDLNIDFYQDVLGSYTSSYNLGLANRSKNLALAARLVNGTVIMPGKRFSYNNTVGPRTYARGFVDATVYTGEGTEEGIGGGICQVSSTIYCAQLRADLKTISRTNHSYTVVYVPLGQDATVVYGSLDYVFENNTNYPIKIVANAGGGYLTVKIMGTKVDTSSSVDIVSVTNSTIPKGETRKDDPSIPNGETLVKQNGQNGAVVSTYKVYYKNGVEQKREFITKSTYRPMNKIILIGTGEIENETAVDPQPPAEEPSNSTQQPDGDTTTEPSEPVITEPKPPEVPETKEETESDMTDEEKTDVQLSENGL